MGKAVTLLMPAIAPSERSGQITAGKQYLCGPVQAAKCVIPFSTLYTPHKQIEDLLVSCPCCAAWAQLLMSIMSLPQCRGAKGMLPRASNRCPASFLGSLAPPELAHGCLRTVSSFVLLQIIHKSR